MRFRQALDALRWIRAFMLRLSRAESPPSRKMLEEQLRRDRYDFELGGSEEKYLLFFPGRSVDELLADQAHDPYGCPLFLLDSGPRRYYQRYYLILLIDQIIAGIGGYREGGELYWDNYSESFRWDFHHYKSWKAYGYEEDERPCIEALSGLYAAFLGGLVHRKRTPELDGKLRTELATFLAGDDKPWNRPSASRV